MRLWLRNSELRSSDSLATTAHFISWNYTNTHNGLFNPCTLIVNELVTNYNQLKQKSCNKKDLSKTSGTLA